MANIYDMFLRDTNTLCKNNVLHKSLLMLPMDIDTILKLRNLCGVFKINIKVLQMNYGVINNIDCLKQYKNGYAVFINITNLSERLVRVTKTCKLNERLKIF